MSYFEIAVNTALAIAIIIAIIAIVRSSQYAEPHAQ